MKKLIALLLIFTICVPMLASCSVISGFFDKNTADSSQNGDETDAESDKIGNSNTNNNGNNKEEGYYGELDGGHGFDPNDPDYILAADIALIDGPSRFKITYTIDREKLENAAAAACAGY